MWSKVEFSLGKDIYVIRHIDENWFRTKVRDELIEKDRTLTMTEKIFLGGLGGHLYELASN